MTKGHSESIYFSSQDYEHLLALAALEGKARSRIVREALAEYYKRHGKGAKCVTTSPAQMK